MDSCSDTFEDLVKYNEHELEKALSWVICWRRQVEQYAEGEGSTSLQKRPSYSAFPYIEEYDDIDVDDEDEMTEAKWAGIYAMQAQAEERVVLATMRLEQSKQKLQGMLAEFGPSSNGTIAPEDPGLQSPITPPNSQSPESLPKIRRLSKKKTSTGKGHRRSKKENVRKAGAKVCNANTAQRSLPPLSLISEQTNEEDDDVEMSDDEKDLNSVEIQEGLQQADFEDAVMSDIEDPPKQTPPSPPKPHPRSTANTQCRKMPSPTPQGPASRKTRSATKLEQASSSKVLKNSSTQKPSKKAKAFTEQQTAVLLDAASTNGPRVGLTNLRRSERLRGKAAASEGRRF